MFVYQPTFNMLQLKTDKGTEYITGWKSKGFFEWKLFLLHGAFMPNAKQFGYKIGIQFNNTSLDIDQDNFTTKTVNAYSACDLDNCPKIPLRNLTLRKCLFGATNIAKNS